MFIDVQVFERKPDNFNGILEIAAVYVAVCGKLLLLQLADRKQEAGAWGVPAGKLHLNETPEAAAKRELFEETGIEIAPNSSFEAIGKLYIRKPGIDYVYHLFGHHMTHVPDIRLSCEHSEYKWASREEAEQLRLMKGAEQALNFYCRNVSEKGGK